MEELVGEFWHRFITKQATLDFDAEKAELNAVRPLIAPFYRALGGDSGKVIEVANPRELKLYRRFLQRVAGTNKRVSVSWQDARSVRLPPKISLFPERHLNENLYFWLTALAAALPELNCWVKDNQAATRFLIDKYPGLKKRYFELVDAFIAGRLPVDKLKPERKELELALRQALWNPGAIDSLPEASRLIEPNYLWLYPAPLYEVGVAAEDDIEDDENVSGHGQQQKPQGGRKQAKRIDDTKETDGLVVFMLDSLFSWTEQVELDRAQQEDTDVDIMSASDDLDIISLSKKRRAQSAKIKFDLDLPAPQNDDLALGPGLKLPEWDFKKARLVDDYCLLQPMLDDAAMPSAIPDELKATARELHQRFSALTTQSVWLRRQDYGTELDLDACLEHFVAPNGHCEKTDLYRRRQSLQRDLSCLLLADLSMSTDSSLNTDKRVIDVIRDSMLLFGEALSGAGDPFAIYGFSSIKNKQVRYQMLKNFNESYSDATRGRIIAVKPGFYTRMGAGIRQSVEVLKTQSTEKRLLLILSDGKPNDIDHYEGRYGVEDTRHAVLEAKKAGIEPFCITVDESGNDYLPYLFGDKGYAVVNDVLRLPTLLPKLYLSLTTCS